MVQEGLNDDISQCPWEHGTHTGGVLRHFQGAHWVETLRGKHTPFSVLSPPGSDEVSVGCFCVVNAVPTPDTLSVIEESPRLSTPERQS